MKRRKFVELTSLGSAAAAASIWFPSDSDDRKIKIGLIGAGWYGMVISKAALSAGGAEIAAVCDVDSEHLVKSADELQKIQGTRPVTYKYYQDLLEMKGLDAIFIGTPPQWHALQFIAACEKGYDIYCEKPLSYDVREGIAMVSAARKAGNIVQIGFQRRQSNAFKKVKELIEAGIIGNIHRIVAQINYIPVLEDTTVQDPPASLDWDEWCGPAPKLDYRPNIGHKAWRLEKEYGNGHLVDWGIHHIDIIRCIMNEGMPTKFVASGGINVLKGQITTPDTLTVDMEFESAPVFWQHRLWGTGDVTREYNNGIFFYGENGTIFADDSKVIMFPADRSSLRNEMVFSTPQAQVDHVRNFLDAVRKKDKNLLSCTPEDAFLSTATVQLSMIAYYTGSPVIWDPLAKEIKENQTASAMLTREYRSKYTHP